MQDNDEKAFKKPKNPGGRPLKLNKKLIEKISNAIRVGAYVETAATYAGVQKSTFYEWLKLGASQPNTLYEKFSNAIEKAMADAELRDLQTIDKAATVGANWKAAAWRLERKFPRKWGRFDRMESTALNGQQTVVILPARKEQPEEPPLPPEETVANEQH